MFNISTVRLNVLELIRRNIECKYQGVVKHVWAFVATDEMNVTYIYSIDLTLSHSKSECNKCYIFENRHRLACTVTSLMDSCRLGLLKTFAWLRLTTPV